MHARTTTTIDANGVELHVEQAGTGDDVICISGLADEGACWVDQVDGLGDRWRITTFDNRGVGRSAAPDGRVPDRATSRPTPRRSWTRWASSARTWSAPPWAVRSPRSSRSRTPGGCAASSSTAPTAEADHFFREVIRSWQWAAAEVRQPARLPERREPLVLLAADLQRGDHGGVAHGGRGERARAARGRVRADRRTPSSSTTARIAWARSACPRSSPSASWTSACPSASRASSSERIPGATLRVIEANGHQPFQESPEAYNAILAEFWAVCVARAAARGSRLARRVGVRSTIGRRVAGDCRAPTRALGGGSASSRRGEPTSGRAPPLGSTRPEADDRLGSGRVERILAPVRS